MENSKYQIAISAVNNINAPFKSASATVNKLTGDIKGQSAEIKNLNSIHNFNMLGGSVEIRLSPLIKEKTHSFV